MYIVFDIGGTNMRVAGSSDGKELGEPAIAGTPGDFEEGMKVFEDLVSKVSGGEKIEAIAGGIAGVFDAEHTQLLRSPNLLGWMGKPIKEELTKRFGVPIYLYNDCDMDGVGEAVAGAGQDFKTVAYLTVSTGVGGSLIVAGEPVGSGFGLEPGQQIIDRENSLEDLVSGAGFKKRFEKKAEEISNNAVWEMAAKDLAIGIHNTIVHWSPDVVVLGGKMITGNPAIDLGLVEENLKRIMKIFPTLPPIRKAELGDKSGLIGALELLNKHK